MEIPSSFHAYKIGHYSETISRTRIVVSNARYEQDPSNWMKGPRRRFPLQLMLQGEYALHQITWLSLRISIPPWNREIHYIMAYIMALGEPPRPLRFPASSSWPLPTTFDYIHRSRMDRAGYYLTGNRRWVPAKRKTWTTGRQRSLSLCVDLSTFCRH